MEAVVAALEERGVDRTLVHTGQHYDPAMSDTFFPELDIPTCEQYSGMDTGAHLEQTARVVPALEPVVTKTRLDWMVIVRDVNLTPARGEPSTDLPIVFPLRPGTRQRIDEFGFRDMPGSILSTEALGDLQVPGLRSSAEVVLTLSGGTEEETTRTSGGNTGRCPV